VPPIGVGRGPTSVDFFQPGGIYRDVSLRILPSVFLSDLFARPAGVLSKQPRVDVACTIDSATAPRAAGTLRVELLDGDTRIATQTATIRVTSPGISTTQLSLTDLGPISLWSPDNPKLYNVQATLSFPGGGSHVLTKRIGFREASFRPSGFFLNGERLQLLGLNRHQLYPYAGMAMPARVQRKDVEILKNELNCNMVRCSHYPQSPHFLDACDEAVIRQHRHPGTALMGCFHDLRCSGIDRHVVGTRIGTGGPWSWIPGEFDRLAPRITWNQLVAAPFHDGRWLPVIVAIGAQERRCPQPPIDCPREGIGGQYTGSWLTKGRRIVHLIPVVIDLAIFQIACAGVAFEEIIEAVHGG